MAEVVEEKKTGQYNGILYECSFTAEGKGVTCVEQPVLKVVKPGVRINLMRIALINRTPKFTPLMLEGVGKDEFMPLETPKGAPDVEGLSNYVYASTSLRPGFLYVINESDSDGWSEWEVGLGGWLKEIDKSQAESDFRKVTSDAVVIDQYVAEPTDVLWFAYSEIQWSADYFKSMRDDSSKRGTRMQKYDLIKHVNNESQNDAASWDIMKNNFLIIPENKLDYNVTQQNYTIASFDETNNTESYKLDAILCLHDPVGIFIEHFCYLKYLWNKMDYLMISLKIGKEVSDIERALAKGQDPRLLQNAEKLEQIDALYNIAVNIRAVAFSDQESIDKIGDNIDAKRLNKVLATEERLLIKNKIVKSKMVFAKFIESDYFKRIKQDYFENTPNVIMEGKFLFASLMVDLWKPANFKDSFLETVDESAQWNASTKEGKEFIIKVLNRKNFLGKLFNTVTLLEDVEENSNNLKLIKIIDALFDVAKGVAEEGDEVLKLWVAMMNSTRLKINGKVVVATFELTTMAKEYRKSYVGRSDFVKNTLNINKKSYKKFKKATNELSEGFMELMESKQIKLTASFEKAIKSETLNGMKNFQASYFWRKLMRSLSFVNLALATAALRKSDSKFQKLLNISKFLTAISEVNVQVRNVKAMRLVGDELEVFKIATEKLSIRVMYAGAVIDIAEAGLNFWERDYDAASAYAGAAVTGLLAALILGGTINIWNPIGWGCLILGALLGFYAAYLEDSPLERFAKNGVFGSIPSKYIFWKTVDFDENNGYLKYIEEHVKETTRVALHKTGFGDWADYPTQYKDFMNILIGGRIHIKINKNDEVEIGETMKAGSYADKSKVILKTFLIKKIQVTAFFGSYLTDKEALEYHVFYLPQGFGKEAEEVTTFLCQSNITISTLKSQVPKAHWSIDLEYLYDVNKYSQIIIMCRLNINNNQFFPIPKKTIPRYIAVTIPVIRNDSQSGFVYRDGLNDRVYVGTQQELLNKKIWK